MPQQWTQRLIHYQYIAELLEGRRVLEVGCDNGRGAAFVAELADHVVAVDTSSIQLGENRRIYAQRNLEFMVGEPDRLQLDNRAFDVVLIPELTRWMTRGSFLPEIQRVLAQGGVALFAVASADREGNKGMAFTDLAEYLNQGFHHVRLLGEIPFHGTIVADFEPGEEIDPQLDCSLVEEDAPPSYYLALCSDEPLRFLGYSVVQHPSTGTSLFQLESLHEKFDRLVEERAEAELKIEELRRQLADAERRVLEAGADARHELTGLRRELREKQQRGDGLQRELEQAQAALQESRSLQTEEERAVEDVVQDLRRQLDEHQERGQIELQQSRQRLEQHVEASQRRIRQLEEELRRARSGSGGDTELLAELQLARGRVLELEQELDDLRHQQATKPGGDDEKTTSASKLQQLADLSHPHLAQRRVLELERRLDRELARADALEERLQRERERVDRERDRAEEAIRTYLEERSRAETEHVRAEGAERVLTETRAMAEQHRTRAEGAERRCDALVIRIEQGAGELSNLHQRIAELQALRQADLWRIDELTGRLRSLEGHGGEAGGEDQSRAKQRMRELELDKAQLTEQLREQERLREAEAHALQELEQRAAAAQQQATELQQAAAKVPDLERELMRSESRVVEYTRKATNAEAKVAQHEVRLKRSEAEAATLSKWAEELREELKEAQGKSSVRPVTPEPEVAALRNDVREGQTRITDLEQRCDRFMHDAEDSLAAQRAAEERLQEALRSADGTILSELDELRRHLARLEGADEELERTRHELAEIERQLRETEHSDFELKRTRRELEELRRRVRDVDGASEELEALRLKGSRQREMEEELARLRNEAEGLRIDLARAQDEMRGAAGLPAEAAWRGFGEEEEPEPVDYDSFVGPDAEMPGEDESEEESRWEAELQTRERQLEALLEGAALHREEMERFQTQIGEMDALAKELQGERDELDARVVECERVRTEQRATVQDLRDELLRVGRDLARAQGELRRCQGERDHLVGDLRAGGQAPRSPEEAVLRADLEREIRERQRLQEDVPLRLREVDEARRQLWDKERSLDAVRSEDTEHRAELRQLRRQVRELEERLAGGGTGSAEERQRQLTDLGHATALMAELEQRLRVESQRLAGIEEQLRDVARGEWGLPEGPAT